MSFRDDSFHRFYSYVVDVVFVLLKFMAPLCIDRVCSSYAIYSGTEYIHTQNIRNNNEKAFRKTDFADKS